MKPHPHAEILRAIADGEQAMQQEIDELRAALPVWQPISTAPKNGTEILVCRAVAADGKPIKADSFGLFVQRAAWWEGEDDWIVYCSLIQEPAVFFDPTHWQPLPQPPETT